MLTFWCMLSVIVLKVSSNIYAKNIRNQNQFQFQSMQKYFVTILQAAAGIHFEFEICLI